MFELCLEYMKGRDGLVSCFNYRGEGEIIMLRGLRFKSLLGWKIFGRRVGLNF